MFGKDTLLFRFRKDSSTYYYIDSSGNVATSSTPVNTQSSLYGWDELEIQWKRSKKYQGVFRIYMPDMCRFVKNGARILNYIFHTQGYTAAVCQLEILKLNSSDLLHYPLVVCDIDFSRFKAMELYVDVAVIQGGITAQIDAYADDSYAIEIGEPQSPGAEPSGAVGPATNIYMDGVPYITSYNYVTTANDSVAVNAVTTERTLAVTFVDQEDLFFKSQNTVSVGTAQSVGSSITPITTAEYILLTGLATAFGSIDVELNIDRIENGPATGVLSLIARVYDISSGFVDHLIYAPPPMTPGITVYPGVVTVSIPLSPVVGDRIVIFVRYSGGFGATIYMAAFPSKIRLTYNYIAPATLAPAYTHYQLFQMLVQNIISTNPVPAGTGFPLTMGAGSAPPAGYNNLPAPPAKSDLLSTSANIFDVDPTKTYFTSGNSLRNIQYTGNGTGGAAPKAYINVSMKDFVKDAFVSLCAGLGVERISGVDKVVIEHLSHFYQAGVLIKDLGSSISDFSIDQYNEDIGTTVKTGYKETTYNDANGNWEFNRETTDITPATRELSAIDLITPFRADPYGIESSRLDTNGQPSTDAKSDTDVFKIQSDGSDAGLLTGDARFPQYNTSAYTGGVALPAKVLKRSNGVTSGLPQIGVSGGVANGVFNVPFTPKRQKKRVLPWLKSVLYGLPTTTLYFKKAGRQLNLVTNMGTGAVDEWANESLAPAGDLLFKPLVFSFTCEAPIDLADLMATNPYGVFGFTYGGVYLEGFVLECGVTPGKVNTYNFRLLCSPNTTVPAYLFANYR